jgi:glyoxylase-like metal-dependent hydrolase (beta-lactamase superfamily II)
MHGTSIYRLALTDQTKKHTLRSDFQFSTAATQMQISANASVAPRTDMNTLEHQLDYPFGATLPTEGRWMEVAPGIHWIRMPLPFALDHINLWLLRDEIDGKSGWTIVDCGVGTSVTKALWEQIFTGALKGLPVLRVLVTHCHPDHVGLADWLCQGGEQKRWKAQLWMTQSEYLHARLLHRGENSNVAGPLAAMHFARNGLEDTGVLGDIAERTSYYPKLVPSIPPTYRRIRDDELLTIGARQWRVIVGFGHSPEHASLYCAEDQVLLSGDMVLPRISTNVSVFDLEPDGDPLALYLESLQRYAEMPDETLVLPAHGKPFRGLQTRIGQLRDHHAARLAETLAECSSGACTAADLLRVLFKRELDAHQTAFAIGEAIAHLHLLWNRGEVVRLADEHAAIRFVARRTRNSEGDAAVQPTHSRTAPVPG